MFSSKNRCCYGIEIKKINDHFDQTAMIAANFSSNRSNEFSVEMIAKIYSVVRKKKIVGRKCQGNFPIKRIYCVISMTLFSIERM